MIYKCNKVLIFVILSIHISINSAEHFIKSSEIFKSSIVRISSGQIQGVQSISRIGRDYFSYLGIPYGEADRFEIARPSKSWDGIKRMNSFGSECYQIDMLNNQISGSEDCLFLNVYTPKIDGNLPVMVYIHGGGYYFGSGSEHDAKYFMDEDVVLITINYRLSIFDTQDGVIEGNLGLKDQTLALKWVQENIHAFGGNADKVTIFGQSAGGASVNFHLISDMSEGLFHHAISQSGSALVGWVMQMTPQKNVLKLAQFVNCSDGDMTESVNCLKSKNALELLIAADKFRKVVPEFDQNFVFTPTVESIKNKQIFMKDCPLKLLKAGNFNPTVPFISGVTSNEGALNLRPLNKNVDLIRQLNENWEEIAPWLLVYQNKVNQYLSLSDISNEIWDHFIKSGGGINDKTWQNLTDTVSDRWNVHGITEAMKHWSEFGGLVYPYYFSFSGNFSYSDNNMEQASQTRRLKGVGHSDELQYLFSGYNGAPEYNAFTKIGEFSQKLVKLWVNFAKDGTVKGSANDWVKEWPSISKMESSWTWLEIDEEAKLKPDPFRSRMEFWNSLNLMDCPLLDSEQSRDEL